MNQDAFPDATLRLERRRRRIGTGVGIAVLLFVAFVTLRGHYHPLGPAGIDPGWQWAINQAREAGHVFGRDIVFTYGPLGFLMMPMDLSNNLLVANTFHLGIQLLFAAALVGLFWGDRWLAGPVVFAVLFLCARHQGLVTEAFLQLVVGLLALMAVVRNLRWPLAVASGLAAVLFLVKMSLGVASVALVGAAFVIGHFLFRRRLAFFAGLVTFPIVLGLLGAVFFDSSATFLKWLQLSSEVVSGYSVANSIVGPPHQVAVGLALMAAWLAAAAVVRKDRLLFACILVFAPIVLIQFRLAFVRQDSHQLQFVPFILALIAICALFCRLPRQLTVCGLAFALVLAIGAVTGLADPQHRGLLPGSLWRGGSGPDALARLLNLETTRAELAIESARNLESLRLPEEWRQRLDGAHNGVGALPWEIQYSPANGLPWNPTPTLQLYSSYTRDLDLWGAGHYAGAKAPRFILNRFAAMGKRRQFFDAPATWRTIFMNYRLRSVWQKSEPLLLLERRVPAREWVFDEVGRDTITLESAGMDVPPSRNLLFADIDLEFNFAGHVQKSIFRVPLIFLLMTYESGQVTVCRLIPGTSNNGLLINAYPRDVDDYVSLWRAEVRDRVVRCTITGPGTAFFKPDAAVTWRELRPVAH